MPKFTLPLVEGNTRLKDAFEPMIRTGVSGLVVRSSTGFRLLHFDQVNKAFEASSEVGLLNEVQEYVHLGDDVRERSNAKSTGSVVALETGHSIVSAVIEARSETFAQYMTQSAGYCCTGPDEHCYPPNKRGSTDDCVVPLCPGKLP
jgi:hypothetical protein